MNLLQSPYSSLNRWVVIYYIGSGICHQWFFNLKSSASRCCTIFVFKLKYDTLWLIVFFRDGLNVWSQIEILRHFNNFVIQVLVNWSNQWLFIVLLIQIELPGKLINRYIKNTLRTIFANALTQTRLKGQN